MKRAMLIVGGALGGLGAVMAITPPQLNSAGNLAISGAGAIGGGVKTNPSPTPATSIQATPTKRATKAVVTKTTKVKKRVSKAVATKKTAASARATAKSNNSNSGVVAATPTPAATKTGAPTPVQTPASKAVTGTFTGPAIFVNYGTVQVQLTVKDGRITDATALQAPTGRNSRYTDMALPILKKQTLSAQSANIQGASGASYTSYGWFTSLQGALAKAGL